MSNILKSIKNGNTEEFFNLVSHYSNDIYTAVSNSYEEEESINISKQIIINLFNDINSKYFWQKPDKFIHKSLMKSYRHYHVKNVNKNNGEQKTVPAQVLRAVMVDLSKNMKRKGFVNNTLKIVAGLMVISLLCTFTVYYTMHISKPKDGDTLYKAISTPKLLIQDTYYKSKAPFFVSNCSSNLVKLGNTGVCLDIMSSIDYKSTRKVRIYSKGIKLKEINVDLNWQVIGGNIDSNYLIFIDSDKIIRTDLKLNNKQVIQKNGNPIIFSPNGRYAVFNKGDLNEVIDFNDLKKVKEVKTICLEIDNSGEVKSYNIKEFKTLFSNKKIIAIKALNDGSKVVLMSNGSVVNIKDNKVIWMNELKIDSETFNNNPSFEQGYILKTSDKVHVIIQQKNGVFFQSYTLQGTPIHKINNTLKEGCYSHKTPITLEDGDIMLINGFDSEYRKNYFTFILTDKVPMKEMKLVSYGYDKYLFEKGENVAYLYADSKSDIDIFEISLTE
ncbi:hypothetical protein IMX26_01580 [Clostridium sp. 'deep sea']|uniref:hypothetical protein n=1 Tax=Clostridium sp. 'deep sea' TaxID=2779445 RepID=UPI00189684F8|nr:hypothetical protein [Clostridium sp. 'deep sea']QOR35561.1 hypothetical protein IMX26_01580 [Clostridium sp. 'deep sea']